jgi:two-component system response regulator YesN
VSYCSELLFSDVNCGIFVILNFTDNNKDTVEKLLFELPHILKKITDLFDCLDLIIGVGSVKNDIKNISDCVFTADKAVKYGLTIKNTRLIEYEKYVFSNVSLKDVFTPEIRTTFIDYLKMGACDNCVKIVKDCFAKIFNIQNYSPVILYDAVNLIMLLIKEYAEESLDDTAYIKGLISEYKEKIDNTKNVQKLVNEIIQLIERTSVYLSQELSNKDIKPIRIAKSFIDEHYMEQITLRSVSEKVHITENYLSSVFRKETGINFSEYLINIRIKAATEFLSRSNMPISVIAEKVGYTDIKYFSKLFNKVIGLKPSEYRKLYSR